MRIHLRHTCSYLLIIIHQIFRIQLEPYSIHYTEQTPTPVSTSTYEPYDIQNISKFQAQPPHAERDVQYW